MKHNYNHRNIKVPQNSYDKQLCVSKLDNLGELDKFLEMYKQDWMVTKEKI